MKKTAIAAAVGLAIGIGSVTTADANTAGLTGVWTGLYNFTMYSPTGGLVNAYPDNDTWTWDFDNGTVLIPNTATFYSSVWTAHDVTFADNGTSYNGGMLFDWSSDTNIVVESDWDVTATGNAVGDTAVVTVISSVITAPDPHLFLGFQPFFESGTGDLTKVPVPAAVWLFGSGLMGLVGVARRRRRS